MSSFSAIVIGNESLLIQCASLMQGKGHRIAAVVTRNAEIEAWARENGLRVEAPGADLAARLGDVTCDWLFSIANLSVIPDAVLAKAGQGAINFHDGPLPAYAGLNAPVWAIVNREAQHGVTWHRIEGGVDEGNILEQRIFDLGEAETALTLNTRCYAAAIDGFEVVLGKLEAGDVAGGAQDLSQRSYYARTDRPRAHGRLDFNRDSEDLVALVRALDHGAYWNPLCVPKIEIAGRIAAVRSAEISTRDKAPLPGSVLELGDEHIVVATGSAPVILKSITSLDGEAIRPSDLVSVGDVLPSLNQPQADALTERMKQVASHDGFWRRHMAELDPAELPQAQISTEAPDWARRKVDLPAGLSRMQRLTALTAWAARISGKDAFDLAYRDAGVEEAHDAEPLLLNPWVPLRFDADQTFAKATDAMEASVETCRKRGAFARDLILREPSISGSSTPQIGLATSGDTAIEGTCLTLLAGADGQVELVFDTTRLSEATADTLVQRLDVLARSVSDETMVNALAVLSDAERDQVLNGWNRTDCDYPQDRCVHQLFEEQAARTPDGTALVFEGSELTYAELDARANKVAHVLREMGVGPDGLVGLYTSRSLDLVVGALAIQKAGGAYVPLDPAYPADRIALYIEDSQAKVILAQSAIAGDLPDHRADVLLIDQDSRIAAASETAPDSGVTSANLAYVIYTSGSTGRPKGVMVEHRNVANFFTGMDQRISQDGQGVWLAVTSLSFDISVLELFYTLARGYKVVLSSDENRALISSGKLAITDRDIDFSLFYWGNDDGVGPKKYELLLEGAKIADANGFCAVWTPERHFHAFGGPYPNPSVTGAAVAAVTKNLAVRAGSCVAPLHHPARIAEEWAVIDNITNGRTGLAIASGWQPDDFILRPENTPPQNKPAMFEAIETLRKLWRGEAVEFATKDGTPHAVVTQPRPVSKELPVWVTTAGNPQTWKQAGSIGANVLTHLLGQSVDEVGEKIKIYHAALREAGHDPADHKVTLMLHTFVGDNRDTVRKIAHEPMKDYLRSAAGLIKQYAWAFPAFKRPEGVKNPFELDLGSLNEDEMEGILDFAFERYFEDSGLFGTIEDCLERVEQVKRIGVDEIACLIDYGIPVPEVLGGLEQLAEVLRRAKQPSGVADDDYSIAAQIIRHNVTHMQCTPSMARMIAMNDEARFALGRVKHLMIGGEALPGALVEEFAGITRAAIENMYGPTETTIWSSTETAQPVDGIVNIGSPIANTQLYVLDEAMDPVPVGVPGELWIGGAGVTRGYLHREDLTAERFKADPFRDGNRIYRTGDLVRWREDGRIDFFGRADHQVKIRGYRIELGEIEARLNAMGGVSEAVVIAREDTPGDVRLVAYLTGGPVDEAAMRAHLAAALPDYMVPSRFVSLPVFPLTPNKKVDRKALPLPTKSQPVRNLEPAAAPANEVEQKIAEIWGRILGIDAVGQKDNFFELGGHSLLAVQAHREIRAGLDASRLTITDIFRFPTLGALAEHIGGKSKDAVPVDTVAQADRARARTDAMSRRRAMRENRQSRR